MALLLLLLFFIPTSTAQIVVYNITEEDPSPLIIVTEACPNRCPNEYLSDGYNQPDPQDTWEDSEPNYELQMNQVILNVIPFVNDPIMRSILKSQMK